MSSDISGSDTAAATGSERASPRIKVDSRTIEELDAAICRLARHLHAETYRLLMLIRDFDDRFGWAKWSFESCAEWLAWRCQLSLSAAREKVRTAHALRELPAISAAFAAGRLSYSKVRALTRVAHRVEEKELLAYALDATAAQVEERCRQIRNVAPESAEAARRAWERRSLTVARHPGRGTLLISAELPAEDGELIVRALESAVASGEVALGVEYVGAYGADRAGTDRSRAIDGWRAQQADALLVMARAYLAGRGAASRAEAPAGSEGASAETAAEVQETAGESAAGEAGERAQKDAVSEEGAGSGESGDGEPGNAVSSRPGASAEGRARSLPDHYQLIVHVDERALRGGVGCSDLPIETVKRLACDGSLIALVEDEAGTPLALGRKRRVVSPALRRLLWARDRGCTFPGCHRRHYAEAHHLHHWAEGGKTDPANTALLCSFHHRLLHEGGFSVRRRGGRLEFLRADGRVIPRSGYRREDMVDDTAGAAAKFPRADANAPARTA